MPSRLSAVAVLLALAAGASLGQPPGQKLPDTPPEKPAEKALEKPADKAPEKPAAKAERVPEFDVAFADNSNVKVVFLDQTVGLTTRYGKLTIPMADLRRVEFGFRYPEGVEAKVAAAVERLAAPAFLDREQAGKDLVELKEFAGPQLVRAAKDPNPERRTRADGVLKTIRPGLAEDRVNAKDYDTVETAEFTIRGRLETTTFRVRTKQFGDAVVRLAEVKQFKAVAAGALAGEITLDAAKYAKLNWSAWLDTGTDVTAGTPLDVTATGRVDQWPQEAGRYMTGPGGNGQPAQNVPFPVRAAVGRPQFDPNGRQVGQVQSGMIVGKIGEGGQPFAVGDNLKLTAAPATGKLFLLIAPSHWGNDNSAGEYKIRVTVGGVAP